MGIHATPLMRKGWAVVAVRAVLIVVLSAVGLVLAITLIAILAE
jgi:hypothetical protein